jgi:2-polyprenyl-3-methyl-5-hydroxy-6-metoxy-1,4-benzoquinol methylase
VTAAGEPAGADPGFWREHFRRRHRRGGEEGLAKSLDYSNERVRIQTYAHVLEGLGEVAGRALLDAGCGWGSFALLLHACGARVTAFDLVPETIAELARRHPEIDWRAADVADPAALAALGRFDGVAATEVLQYVPFGPAVRALWAVLAPGGRLVAAVPNRDCPIVARVAREQEGRYRPVSQGEIRELAADVGAEAVRILGLTFLDDQRFLPYAASGWGDEAPGRPNRLVFALVKGA